MSKLIILVCLALTACVEHMRSPSPVWMSFLGEDSATVARKARDIWHGTPDSVVHWLDLDIEYYHGAALDTALSMQMKVVFREDTCVLLQGYSWDLDDRRAESLIEHSFDSVTSWLGPETRKPADEKALTRALVHGGETSWKMGGRQLNIFDSSNPSEIDFEYYREGSDIPDYFFARMVQRSAHLKGDSALIRRIDSVMLTGYD